MKKGTGLLITALAVIVLLSACAGGIRSGTFVITNDTNATLTITIVAENRDDISGTIGANDSLTEELGFGLFEGSRVVTVTVSGLYKAEEDIEEEVYAGEETVLTINADRGAANFDNATSTGETALVVWLVPDIPNTYPTGDYNTTVAAIEAAAVSRALDVPLGSSKVATSSPGTYYLMWEDSVDIWWYVADPTWDITVNQTTDVQF